MNTEPFHINNRVGSIVKLIYFMLYRINKRRPHHIARLLFIITDFRLNKTRTVVNSTDITQVITNAS